MSHPFIPVPGVVKCEFVYQQDSQIIENVLHFKYTGGDIGIAELIDITDGMLAFWTAVLKPIQVETVSLLRIKATDLTSQDGETYECVDTLPLPGNGLGGALPLNVTVVAKVGTVKRGRSYRGRIYHVGLQQTQVSGNHITAGTQTLLQTGYGALIGNTYHGVEWGWVVVSYYTNGAWRTTGHAEPVAYVTVDTTLDSQRRRLPGRGR